MVDDEPELVTATVGMLARELGSDRVRGSTDPRAVAGWIEKEKPAALITDVRMPHLTGLELVTQLHDRWGAVPVVVMTAYPTAQVDRDARAGRFAYLPKPFAFHALRETLTRICAQPAPSAFSGAIAVTMLAEVVQLYGLAGRTGTLRVRSDDGVGDIAFDGGRVVDAVCDEFDGVDAFNLILKFKSGQFSWDPLGSGRRTIHTGLSELLLEAYRRRDEEEAGAATDVDDAFAEFEGASSARSQLQQRLRVLESTDGFLGATLLDMDQRKVVAALDPANRHIADAALAHTDLVNAKKRTIAALQIDDVLEDIVISLSSEYHLLRPSRRQPQLLFFVALDRRRANLAMARYQLSNLEGDTVL